MILKWVMLIKASIVISIFLPITALSADQKDNQPENIFVIYKAAFDLIGSAGNVAFITKKLKELLQEDPAIVNLKGPIPYYCRCCNTKCSDHTLLMVAAHCVDLSAMKILLAHNADPSITCQGRTILDFAREKLQSVQDRTKIYRHGLKDETDEDARKIMQDQLRKKKGNRLVYESMIKLLQADNGYSHQQVDRQQRRRPNQEISDAQQKILQAEKKKKLKEKRARQKAQRNEHSKTYERANEPVTQENILQTVDDKVLEAKLPAISVERKAKKLPTVIYDHLQKKMQQLLQEKKEGASKRLCLDT